MSMCVGPHSRNVYPEVKTISQTNEHTDCLPSVPPLSCPGMKLQNLKWPEIKRIAPKTMAFAPIAALEQHGHHLPLITDTAIGTELAKRIERRFPNKLVLL